MWCVEGPQVEVPVLPNPMTEFGFLAARGNGYRKLVYSTTMRGAGRDPVAAAPSLSRNRVAIAR